MTIDKLKNTGTQAAISFFKEYYMHEFPELSKKFKDDSIEYIIKNNAQIFTKEYVMAYDGCVQCGLCCRDFQCPHHNPKTNLCIRHDDQIMDLCRTYPWSGDLGIYPVLINCRYTINFFKYFFDKYFKKTIEMRNKE